MLADRVSTTARRVTPCRSAFSLAELAVVMGVIGLWAAIAIPRVADSICYHRAESAVARVARDLSFAQKRARFSSASVTVRFDVPGSHYELVGVKALDGPGTTYEVFLGQEPYNAVLTSARFSTNTVPPQVVFNGYGIPDGSGAVVLSAGRYQRTVTVDATTGGITTP